MSKKVRFIQKTLLVSMVVLGASTGVLAQESNQLVAQSVEANASITTDLSSVPYSYLLYGFTPTIQLEGAHFTTTNSNALRNAITLSTPNRILPYRVNGTSVTCRISGNMDTHAVNEITITIDQSVLSVPYDLSVTVPVIQDVASPDAPHEEANKIASLSVETVHTNDFVNGKKAFVLTLKEGEFTRGCIDTLRKSIMETSNIPGMVNVWASGLTKTQAIFTLDGGYYTTDKAYWNFELTPEATTLNETLYVSAEITK